MTAEARPAPSTDNINGPMALKHNSSNVRHDSSLFPASTLHYTSGEGSFVGPLNYGVASKMPSVNLQAPFKSTQGTEMAQRNRLVRKRPRGKYRTQGRKVGREKVDFSDSRPALRGGM
jgi:hypothetical protein